MLENKTLPMRLRERSANESGFTLIELLIVITILGILAAIVVFAVGTTNGDAKKSACQTEVSTVQTAVQAYAAVNNGTYPTTVTALTTVDGGGHGPWLTSDPGTAVSYDKTTGAVTAGTTGTCAP